MPISSPRCRRFVAVLGLASLAGGAVVAAACNGSSAATPGVPDAGGTAPLPTTTTTTTSPTPPAGPTDAAVTAADSGANDFIGCRKLLADEPGTPSGVASIDLDGDGPLAALDLYCDMTFDGGGWTLLQAYTGTNTPADLPDGSADAGYLGSTPAPGTFGALAGWVVKLLAEKSTQAHVRYSFAADAAAADPDSGVWITSLPPSDNGATLPIQNLRNLLVMSRGSDGGFADWAGPQANATELAWPPTCIDGDDTQHYPSMYRACGNPNAMNIIVGLAGRVSWVWHDSARKDPIEVYIR